jgi:hypothetical protein
VRAVRGAEVELELELELIGDAEDVHEEPVFVAHLLADLTGLDGHPAVGDSDPVDWARTNAAALVDAASIVRASAVNCPRVLPSPFQVLDALRAHHGATWVSDPLAVVRAVSAELAVRGTSLLFDEEPEVYLAGTLDELLEPLVNTKLDRAYGAESRATLRVRVIATSSTRCASGTRSARSRIPAE